MRILKFFRDRPIGVSMSFLVFIILGTVSIFKIPVALLPDIPIKKITVKTIAEGYSSREMEDEIANKVRFQLVQISQIENIQSKSYDGLNIIELTFPFGTDMDVALVEVNEQIDRVFSTLPRTISRPTVLQIGASDIPVFYLNISLNNNRKTIDDEINRFALDVVRRRLEQITGVAFVDISGIVEDEFAIIPDLKKMKGLKIDFDDIKEVLQSSILKKTSVNVVRNEFEYQLTFPSVITNIEDIKQLAIKKNNVDIPLKEICKVSKRLKKAKGYCLSNGKQSVSMAIIRQDGSRLGELKENIDKVIQEIKEKNPEIEFEVMNDQSRLLDMTILNLLYTLILGTFLAILVVIAFIKSKKLPLIIGLSIPVSLLISTLFFYLINLSINIISLSGMILGIGMMIDNAIIVVDNINRKYTESGSVNISVIEGAAEIFSPLLSSVLTTTCIFIPLIFLSGLSGALFYDQAVAVAVGLFTSLIVSIILIPVYFKLLNPGITKEKTQITRLFEKLYERGFNMVYKKQKLFAFACIILIVLSLISVNSIKKEKIPAITRLNSLIYIDWNQPVNAEENLKRIDEFCNYIQKYTSQQMAWVGRQQFYLQHIKEQNVKESRIYLSFENNKNKERVINLLKTWIADKYPKAVFEDEIVPNIFDYIFMDNEPDLVLKLYYNNPDIATPDKFYSSLKTYKILDSIEPVRKIPIQEKIGFTLNPYQLKLLNISNDDIIQSLSFQLQANKITSISEGNHIKDVVLEKSSSLTNKWTQEILIYNENNNAIPLNKIGKEKKYIDWTIIYSDKEGEYIPIEYEKINNEKALIDKAQKSIKDDAGWNLGMAGAYFKRNLLFKEMIVVLAVSLLLLYFILAAQFESLVQPLIILIEIPLDILGVVIMLYLFNSSLNIISMIGIIVMSGIVINDSILKIDTINKLIKEGNTVQFSIHKAGHIRLRPILMTSLTTILALIPFLFGKGLGNELQKPLALSIIGGLGLGTVISLIFVPFFYKWLFNLKNYFKKLIKHI